MQKFYLVIPIFMVLAFFLGGLSMTLSMTIFFAIPLTTFWWLHRNDIDIFLEPSTADERICFMALSNRQLIAFVGKKVSEELLKIREMYIKINKNDLYIYKGKIVMFIQQAKHLEPKDIIQLKEEIRPGLLSRRALTSNSFLKSIMFPVTAAVMFYYIPYYIPTLIVWLVLLAGPSYLMYQVWDSGALEFAGGQGANEITVFYIKGSRKIMPLRAESEGELWYSYKGGLGAVKTVDGTDYYYHGTRVFISGAGIPTTVSLDLARKATWFRDNGFRDWNELTKGMEMIESDSKYNKYNSLEDVVEKEGSEFAEEVRDRIRQGEIEEERKMEATV